MRFNGRNILIFFGLYCALMSLTVSVSYFVGRDAARKEISGARIASTTIYELPSVTISLAKRGIRAGSVRMTIDIEVSAKDVDRLESYTPRIMDRIQTRMSDVTPNEFKGRANLSSLCKTLLWEANQASGPIMIFDLFFKEFVFI